MNNGKPQQLGIDPLTLLIMFLREREVINENELSWLMNCHMVPASLRELLMGTPEDRKDSAALMRQISYFENRRKVLSIFQSVCCNFEIEDITPTTVEEELKQPMFPYRCKKCSKQLSFQEVKEVKNKAVNELEKGSKKKKESKVLDEIEKAEKEMQDGSKS